MAPDFSRSSLVLSSPCFFRPLVKQGHDRKEDSCSLLGSQGTAAGRSEETHLPLASVPTSSLCLHPSPSRACLLQLGPASQCPPPSNHAVGDNGFTQALRRTLRSTVGEGDSTAHAHRVCRARHQEAASCGSLRCFPGTINQDQRAE